MATGPPASGAAWKIATFVVSALLAIALAFIPVVYAPLMGGSMKAVARDEVGDHERDLHEAVAEKRAEDALARELAAIGKRLDRIEATLRSREE